MQSGEDSKTKMLIQFQRAPKLIGYRVESSNSTIVSKVTKNFTQYLLFEAK